VDCEVLISDARRLHELPCWLSPYAAQQNLRYRFRAWFYGLKEAADDLELVPVMSQQALILACIAAIVRHEDKKCGLSLLFGANIDCMNAGTGINVVAGLIWQSCKLLVCQRCANAAFPLQWEFPGGKIEKGESDTEALKRELCEELAIDVRGATLVYRHNHRYADGPAVSLRFYHVYDWQGTPRNLIFEKVSWVKLADLERMDFLEGDRPFIQKLIAEGPSMFSHG